MFVYIWLVHRAGSDISQAALAMLIAALAMGVLPSAAGQWLWEKRGRSQRAGDVAFAIAMAMQSVVLIALGLMVPNKRLGG